MRKKKLMAHLEYSWWQYALWLIVAVALWISVFQALAKPKDNEKITIEYFGPTFDAEGLQNYLTLHKESITDQPLKQIRVELNGETNDMMYQLLQARIVTGDIFLIPEGRLSAKNGEGHIAPENYFSPLSDVLQNKLSLDSALYYRINGTPYGVYLPQACCGLPAEERTVAFFSPESVNVGGCNGKGSTSDTAALDILLFLLGESE